MQGFSSTALNQTSPLHQQLKTLLIKKIHTGELKPHENLPSERELGKKMKIARQTVRRAIDEVERMGLVYRIPGKGTYVADQRKDYFHLKVTGFTNFILDSEINKYQTVSLKLINPPEFALNLLNRSEGEEMVLLEQLMSVRGEQRWLQRSYIPRETGGNLLHIEMGGNSVINALVAVCKAHLGTSKDHLIPGIADEHDAILLGIKNGESVQILRGCIASLQGLPIEAHEVVIPGDRFKLDFEFDLNPLAMAELARVNLYSEKSRFKSFDQDIKMQP